MSSKLTLNIQDKELVEEAKHFAKSQNKSLSAMVENILRGLVRKPSSNKSGINEKILGAFKTSKKVESDTKWEYLKEKYNL